MSELTYKSLDQVEFLELVICFNEAFADYLVRFNATEDYLRDRWDAARVDYSLSVGAFLDAEMIGFTVSGVDDWRGQRTAYNAGTGIVPTHRGRGIAGKMFEYLLPHYRAAGITQMTLEVITDNTRAIRAYEKQGFQIVRRMRCLQGEIHAEALLPLPKMVECHRVTQPDWDVYPALSREFKWSWEHNLATVRRLGAQAEAWEARVGSRLLAYCIWEPATHKMVQWGCQDGHIATLKGLFRLVLADTGKIRANNIETTADRSLSLMKDLGLEVSFDQYEMTCPMPEA